jgi:CIC family chloride channel protein
LGILLHWLWPPLVPHPASFVIVGMAGFFAAAAKTPFSTLVIVSEMTGNYNLLLPTLWVCALTFLLSDEQSIYSSQVESRSRSPAHQGDYVREVLSGLQISQFLSPETQVAVLHPGDGLETVMERLGNTPYTALPVTDDNGQFLGMVGLDQVHLASRLPNLQQMLVAEDLMRVDVIPLQPGDRLDLALELFVENNLLELPVVDNSVQRRVIGVVKRAEVSNAYLRKVHGLRQITDGATPA